MGGVLKRTADAAVNQGIDITTVDLLFDILQAKTAVTLFQYTENDIHACF